MEKVRVYNLKAMDKIRTDQRGWMAQVEDLAMDQGFAIKNIHVGTIMPGQVRANHFHKNQNEWIMAFGGSAIFAWRDNDVVAREELKESDIFVFEVSAGCTHAIKNISDHDIYVCAFADQKYNPENPDTFKDEII